MGDINIDIEISKLTDLIALKDQEYQQEFKKQQVFEELRRLLWEKRELQRQLIRKLIEKRQMVSPK